VQCSVPGLPRAVEWFTVYLNPQGERRETGMETSTKLSLGQAAQETGKSKATLSKAIKAGRLSATKNANGGYGIEPVELFRVYPPASQVNGKPNPESEPQETLGELLELRVKLEAERRRNDELQRDKEFLQKELSKATALLTDQREKKAEPAPLPRRPWAWSGYAMLLIVGVIVLVFAYWPVLKGMIVR
jgi:hypothetical protein